MISERDHDDNPFLRDQEYHDEGDGGGIGGDHTPSGLSWRQNHRIRTESTFVSVDATTFASNSCDPHGIGHAIAWVTRSWKVSRPKSTVRHDENTDWRRSFWRYNQSCTSWFTKKERHGMKILKVSKCAWICSSEREKARESFVSIVWTCLWYLRKTETEIEAR